MTASPTPQLSLFTAKNADAALLQAAQLGSDWGQLGYAGDAKGNSSTVSWGCLHGPDAQRATIPAGGFGWQNDIGTNNVPGFAPKSGNLVVY